jgi:hypothetical protein
MNKEQELDAHQAIYRNLVLLETIHPPLSADGRTIKNAFGVVMGQMSNDATAHAIVKLANVAATALKNFQIRVGL